MEYILAGLWKEQMSHNKLLRCIPGAYTNIYSIGDLIYNVIYVLCICYMYIVFVFLVEMGPVLHQGHIITSQMVHFVQQVQYYINFEVRFVRH